MSADDISVALVSSWDAREIVALSRAGGWWKDEYDPAEVPGLSAAVLRSWLPPISRGTYQQSYQVLPPSAGPVQCHDLSRIPRADKRNA